MPEARPRGLLLVMIEVDPAHEEEFNRWYNEEHLPERLGCPGFLSGRRFVALEGEPKYLALYDLESPEVLQSPEYQKIYPPSEWTQKVSAHFLRLVRNVYVEITPEDGDAGHLPERGGRAEPIAEGLLYVEVECPGELETEFHAWYNLEHIPERLRIPGFLSGHRYVALEGSPRWLAVYELESPGVLESAEYRKWAGPLQTPWTTRMVSSTRVRRSVFRNAHRVGQADVAGTCGLVAIRYAPTSPESRRLDEWHDQSFSRELAQIPGVAQAGRYVDTEAPEQLALYHLADPWVSQQPRFASVWTAGWERERDSLTRYKRTLYIRIL